MNASRLCFLLKLLKKIFRFSLGLFNRSLEFKCNEKRILENNFDIKKSQVIITGEEFIYIDSAIANKNDGGLGIKCRITFTNRCYYGLNRQLSSTTKLILYKKPMIPYGAEALLSSNLAALVSIGNYIAENFLVRQN